MPVAATTWPTHQHLAAGQARFDGVAQQVDRCLFELVVIGQHGQRCTRLHLHGRARPYQDLLHLGPGGGSQREVRGMSPRCTVSIHRLERSACGSAGPSRSSSTTSNATITTAVATDNRRRRRLRSLRAGLSMSMRRTQQSACQPAQARHFRDLHDSVGCEVACAVRFRISPSGNGQRCAQPVFCNPCETPLTQATSACSKSSSA